jgi:tRNA-2-methylthio-N6-dimethylallyladenosine synthase
MKYYIQVFGCQMNESDAERARTVLASMGYKPTIDEGEANLVMIVACAVRQKAVDRIYGRAERWADYRRNRPFITILTGCVLEADKSTMSRMFDYILPIKDIGRLPSLVNTGTTNPVINTVAPLDEYFALPPTYQSSFQAFVPISSGCNKFCSYCAVPLTRGREISRPPDEIIDTVKELVQRGYREITLLGQNVNSYGWDFEGVSLNLPGQKVSVYKPDTEGNLVLTKRSVANPMNFPALLSRLAEIDGNFWLRFITSHPYDMSDDLIQVMAKYPKITPYLHLAVQSGSNAILKKMNRQYAIEQYLDRLALVRKLIPDMTISTDIIVGFCGETEADYLLTEKLVKDARFDMAYIAQYSPRPGNVAYDWPDDVLPEDKQSRFDRLNIVLAEVALANNQKLIGTKQPVLIDRAKNGMVYGKTKGFKNIKLPGNADLVGSFVEAKVNSATAWSLDGEIIKPIS